MTNPGVGFLLSLLCMLRISCSLFSNERVAVCVYPLGESSLVEFVERHLWSVSYFQNASTKMLRPAIASALIAVRF